MVICKYMYKTLVLTFSPEKQKKEIVFKLQTVRCLLILLNSVREQTGNSQLSTTFRPKTGNTFYASN